MAGNSIHESMIVAICTVPCAFSRGHHRLKNLDKSSYIHIIGISLWSRHLVLEVKLRISYTKMKITQITENLMVNSSTTDEQFNNSTGAHVYLFVYNW